MSRRTDPDRGLPSLAVSRHERRRALVAGKVRVRAMPPQFWIWALVVLSAVLLIYWWFAQRALVQMRAQVMAKQRAVASVLGPKLVPFGEKMESWASELATAPSPSFVGAAWDYETVASARGVYLRVRLENAREAPSLRKAAVRSLHDGFTACFFKNAHAYDPTEGPPCVTSSGCQPHFLCNEYNVCVEPPRPYNMRLAYRALRVLSSQWTDELHLADSELAITAYERDLESVIQHDVPIAVDIWTQARYATVVLDEAPVEGLPALAPGDPETPEEQLQRIPHFARVGVWSVKDGVPLLRMRGWAGGNLVSAAGSAEVSPASAAAQARQVNSCSLALQVRATARSDSAQPTPSER